ncbi:MAG: hypothetical protein KTV77_05370, partial [Wolbachia endosymbiont of Fragariocoptes setiger]|nr:hypothetical protein [Wolbachia endosymbiont of Fragariocoptes setiger]
EKNRGLKYVENKPKDYSTSSQNLFKNEENKSLIQLSTGGKRPNYDKINSQLYNVTVNNHLSHGLSK